jgi:DNA primase
MTVNVALLKRDHPIEEVIRNHGVTLRRQGRRLVGRCPFHEDERPSLVVYPDTESFYCFGCQAGGDVISFVRRAEGLGFLEAVTRLAGERGGTGQRRALPGERLSLAERMVLTAACGLYHELLLRNPAALRYLASRGVGMRVVRRCRLGYADGRSLRPYLERHRLGIRRVVDLGLLWPGGSEPLAGRVIVPELRGGECIWLLGRALDDAVQPRYWAISRPKPILGYTRVQGRPHVMVTEGAFDYLTGVGWGLPICALLGTHVRAGRLGFLERAARVDLVFDTDAAGRQAAAELAARLGPRARVITLPEGVKDLSDLGRRPDGRKVFARLLDDATCDQADTSPIAALLRTTEPDTRAAPRVPTAVPRPLRQALTGATTPGGDHAATGAH